MLAAAAVGLTGACANQAAPPGGPEDRRPPVVVRTEPDTFAEGVGPDARVRFHFDERISQTVADGSLDDAVTVSPQTGEVDVDHSRSSLTVSVEGGFRPGLVYRVTLLPVISDLFGNRMTEAFEVVFSTGGEAAATATLAGEIWDRVSGRGVDGATVHAVGADSLVHVARTNSEGLFAFRYLPTGDFVLTGFQDANRDQEVGPREARGSRAASVAEGDTLLIDISVLEPDTTAAVVTGASALDSVTIVIENDDFLDPGRSVDDFAVELTREEGDAPPLTTLFHEWAYDAYVDQIADSFAVLDSLEAAARAAAAAAAAAPTDSAAAPPPPADSAAQVATDTVPARRLPSRLPGGGVAVEERPGRTLPGRRLVGLLDAPLEAGEYQVAVTGLVNVNGLPGGGGEVVFTYEPPPPPADSVPEGAVDPAAADSAAAADTAAVADTLGVTP